MRKNVKLAFSGVRLDGKGRRDYAYWDIEKEQMIYFGSKLLPLLVVGRILEIAKIKPNDKGGHSFSGFKYTDEYYEESDTVGHWSAEHRAALARYEMASASKKELSDSVEFHINELVKHANSVKGRAARKALALHIMNKILF